MSGAWHHDLALTRAAAYAVLRRVGAFSQQRYTGPGLSSSAPDEASRHGGSCRDLPYALSRRQESASQAAGRLSGTAPGLCLMSTHRLPTTAMPSLEIHFAAPMPLRTTTPLSLRACASGTARSTYPSCRSCHTTAVLPCGSGSSACLRLLSTGVPLCCPIGQARCKQCLPKPEFETKACHFFDRGSGKFNQPEAHAVHWLRRMAHFVFPVSSKKVPFSA